MLLPQPELERVLSQVRTAFPNLVDWEYSNEAESDYFGFTVWGCLVLRDDNDDLLARRFYVTFDLSEEHWQGVLTIGQHNYLWTSADFGDAHLVNSERYSSLDDAIVALKSQIRDLARAFSVFA